MNFFYGQDSRTILIHNSSRTILEFTIPMSTQRPVFESFSSPEPQNKKFPNHGVELRSERKVSFFPFLFAILLLLLLLNTSSCSFLSYHRSSFSATDIRFRLRFHGTTIRRCSRFSFEGSIATDRKGSLRIRFRSGILCFCFLAGLVGMMVCVVWGFVFFLVLG